MSHISSLDFVQIYDKIETATSVAVFLSNKIYLKAPNLGNFSIRFSLDKAVLSVYNKQECDSVA